VSYTRRGRGVATWPGTSVIWLGAGYDDNTQQYTRSNKSSEIVLACKAEPPDVEWPETLPFTLEDYQYLWGTVATNLEEHEVEVV